ncbi:MAG: sigma-54-dependent Fis family transcriptional regulator [Vicinamibacterales bacterium]|jgi:DNA-binding NtrC family response regulator|nr:sigma-54-dependent Fis family transcriptional regulator [Vicinamibacterales bacterium]
MASHHDLQLPDLVEFRRDEGQIRFHDERVLVMSAAAMGALRREIIASLGIVAARRLLFRFGFTHGYRDAVTLRAGFPWVDPLDGVRMGAMLHGVEGAVHADVVRLSRHPASNRFEAEALWRHSYEAEQHLQQCGAAAEPVCWTLCGYASGFCSACLGRDIYFRETQCAAVSGTHCAVSGRDADSWGAEGKRLRAEYGGDALLAEFEQPIRAAHPGSNAGDRRERRCSDDGRELDLLRERVDQYARRSQMILASGGMRKSLELAARVAPIDTGVLICGESGTGKEFVVRMIHEQSARAGQPLVSVNCAALAETLLESELFGHVRGAFTDAIRDKAGLFEVASAGTLFLDEVGEMSAGLQAKLLRALQEREIRRVGSETSIKASPRIVAATNRDLRAAVHAGAFREDLFYRLAAFVITVPPLRERREAVAPLAQEFLKRAASRFGKDLQGITPEAMRVLLDYDWPGNVRELQHAVERAAILAAGPRITGADLPPELRLRDGGVPLDPGFDLDEHERALIEKALAQFGGNRRRTAEALNISTVTLWRRIKQYGVRAPAPPRFAR